MKKKLLIVMCVLSSCNTYDVKKISLLKKISAAALILNPYPLAKNQDLGCDCLVEDIGTDKNLTYSFDSTCFDSLDLKLCLTYPETGCDMSYTSNCNISTPPSDLLPCTLIQDISNFIRITTCEPDFFNITVTANPDNSQISFQQQGQIGIENALSGQCIACNTTVLMCKNSTDSPSTTSPSTNNPSTDNPSTTNPSTNNPSTDIPTTDSPTTDIPTTDSPTSSTSTIIPTLLPTFDEDCECELGLDVLFIVDEGCGGFGVVECLNYMDSVFELISSIKKYSSPRVGYISMKDAAEYIISLDNIDYNDIYDSNVCTATDKFLVNIDDMQNEIRSRDRNNGLPSGTNVVESINEAITQFNNEIARDPVINADRHRKIVIISSCVNDDNGDPCVEYSDGITVDGAEVEVTIVNIQSINGDIDDTNCNTNLECLTEGDPTRLFCVNSTSPADIQFILEDFQGEICEEPTPAPTSDPTGSPSKILILKKTNWPTPKHKLNKTSIASEDDGWASYTIVLAIVGIVSGICCLLGIIYCCWKRISNNRAYINVPESEDRLTELGTRRQEIIS